MLLSSVILVLQETLEVSLLASFLAAVGYRLQYGRKWIVPGLCSGFILAVLYAVYMRSISEWFNSVGQEVVNASIQTAIAGIIVFLPWSILSGQSQPEKNHGLHEKRGSQLFQLFAAVLLTLAVGREGSEILVYVSGFLQMGDKLQPVMIGGGIGFSIGISVGFLLYYGLAALRKGWGMVTPLILLALFAGNMLSQSSQQLTQADLLPSTQPLWDSSAVFPEYSISGQLLYALIGYDANPSLSQAVAYLAGVALVLLSSAIAGYRSSWKLPKS